MTYDLYTFSGTPFGWRVQLAALLKGADLNIHWLTPTQNDLKSQDMLDRNPRGKVPVLSTPDGTYYESLGVLTYLDTTHEAPPLFGTGRSDKVEIAQVISEVEWYLAPNVQTFASNVFSGQAVANAKTVQASADAIAKEFPRYEDILEQGTFLVGDDVTAADVFLYPVLKVYLRAAGNEAADQFQRVIPPVDHSYPKLAAWMCRIERIPNFDSTWPPGWTN